MSKYRLGISLLLFWMALFPMAFKQVDAATSNIQLVIEGKTYQPDTPPKIVNGRTLVPIAVVAEALGAKVTWDGKQRKVEISGKSVELSMWIGQAKAILNGQEISMDAPPRIVQDRTLVPLRFIGQALGANVGWDDATRTVVVNHVYILTANGNTVNGKVFNFKNELHLPLKEVVTNLGGNWQAERFTLNQQTFTLDRNGQQRLKLKKMDTGWVIPKSAVESELQASVTLQGNRIDVERLSRLQSVREQQGKIFIDFTTPVQPNHFRMSGPERIVIDLPNTVLSEELRTSSGNVRRDTTGLNNEIERALIKDIRFSQFSKNPQTVRVVVELAGKAEYQLNRTATGYEISLKPDPTFVHNPTPAPTPIPTPNPVVPVPVPNKDGFLIVLDAGHGGSQPGATGVSGNPEKDLTLSVTNYLAEELKAYSEFQVILTRPGDTTVQLAERVQIANNAQADVFVSIHGNSIKDKPQVQGTETYYYTAQSKAFANVLHKHLVKATEFRDRGVKVAGFVVIKQTKMPSVLLELGFMSNAAENAQMQDPIFQQRVAKALAEAIYEYYSSL
ncbi:hypothetical protein BEP19_06395 [Ammoniphilus oxalaticus]|uniref:MurNAc-LAA domain-containing protein n=1 Tax=Ammoniphilus oxalaticus TaxID=66863 RepID=A0A419SJ21_9BACL|nr:N-acetylmuramoyl-L-alanine amidase family protein [Ammoniphilus oxalaticus]RKD24034.1 hypothetical protein BEP19_06395 [Ammoniphilus oxalaticus]